MTTIALPRISMPVLDVSSLKFVADAATRKLGYIQLRHHIHEAKLMEVLGNLDLMPFEPLAVKEYMRMQRNKTLGLRRFLPNSMRWRMSSLSNFAGRVPVFVLEDALKLREAAETAGIDVRINVSYLASRQQELDLDPFLVVRIASDEAPFHYIHVWNEPDFYAKRTT